AGRGGLRVLRGRGGAVGGAGGREAGGGAACGGGLRGGVTDGRVPDGRVPDGRMTGCRMTGCRCRSAVTGGRAVREAGCRFGGGLRRVGGAGRVGARGRLVLGLGEADPPLEGRHQVGVVTGDLVGVLAGRGTVLELGHDVLLGATAGQPGLVHGAADRGAAARGERPEAVRLQAETVPGGDARHRLGGGGPALARVPCGQGRRDGRSTG